MSKQAQIKIEVAGEDRVASALMATNARVKEIRIPALLAAGEISERAMKAHVPIRSGETHDSISTETKELGAVAFAETGPKTFYASFIEFGTSNPNYPVQPFVRPAVAETKDEVEAVISQMVAAAAEAGAI